MRDRGEDTPLDDKPELSIGEEIYFDDFQQLGTERLSGMGIGRIPITRIIEYGIHEGVVRLDLFKQIMLTLDAFYVKLVSDEQERKMQAGKAKSKAKRGGR